MQNNFEEFRQDIHQHAGNIVAATPARIRLLADSIKAYRRLDGIQTSHRTLSAKEDAQVSKAETMIDALCELFGVGYEIGDPRGVTVRITFPNGFSRLMGGGTSYTESKG